MASAVLTAALTRSDRTLWAGMCSRGHRHAAAAARTVPAIFAPGWPEQYCPLVQSCRPPDRPENLTRITWSIGLGMLVRPAAAMAASTTFRKDTGTPNWFGRYCPKGQYRAARSRDLLSGHEVDGPRQEQRSSALSRNRAHPRLRHEVEGPRQEQRSPALSRNHPQCRLGNEPSIAGGGSHENEALSHRRRARRVGRNRSCRGGRPVRRLPGPRVDTGRPYGQVFHILAR